MTPPISFGLGPRVVVPLVLSSVAPAERVCPARLRAKAGEAIRLAGGEARAMPSGDVN